MQLVLVSDHPGQNSELVSAAGMACWAVACETDYAQWSARLANLQADAAVLIAERVNDSVLQVIRAFNRSRPVPVVLFTGDAMQQSIRDAVSAGVSAYVVDCSDVGRIGTLLDVAVIRFTELQQLKKELHKAKTTLAERNAVEKAKGIIMRQRRVSEDVAYRMLRKLAMDRNRRIGEVATEIIAVAEVLI